MAQAKCQEEQDILRAELCAAVVVILQAKYGVLHMDSQAAIDMLLAALTVDDSCMLMYFEHCDWLLQVWQERHHVNVRIQ